MKAIEQYLSEMKAIINAIDRKVLEDMVYYLVSIRNRGGRLFFLGVGGGAGHASHAVCDFRKLGGFEAYSPVDNVSELTAQINDNGWEQVYVNWLKESRLRSEDGLFVLSVGGGNLEYQISSNLCYALNYGKEIGATILGVVGRDGGSTATLADACLIIPTVNEDTVTPHTETFQAAIWHLLISHPSIQRESMKWESSINSHEVVRNNG